MSGAFLAIALSIVLSLVFWFLQIRTSYLGTRYYLQVCGLFAIAVTAGYVAYSIFASQEYWAQVVLAILIGLYSLYHFGLLAIRVTAESDGNYRWIHRANRALVNYDCPHNRFTLRTQDGVNIQAISLSHEDKKAEKAIIVCHGAGRSKNTMPVVQTVRILATKYDVFTFDFRGHLESGGVFRTNGDTDYDLQAMIDYVEGQGYTKIAVFGWSIGAWTALLSASRGRHIDAIIAGSPPPIQLSALRLTKALERWRILAIPVLAGVAVMRNMKTTAGKYALSIQDFVRKIPEIPILLVYNDYDYTLKVSSDAFEQLYEKLPITKERLCFEGNGHLFDWPNMYFLWVKMFDWLEHNF